MAEFIAYAKAHRGEMNFGGSLGTPPQLMGSMFSKVAGLGMTYVPYKGGAPSIADLMTGRLHMQFDALTLLQPLVKDGKLRALAVLTPKRWPDLPDVPTLREAGLRRFPRQSLGRHHGAAEARRGRSSTSSTPPSTTSCARTEAKESLAKLNVLLRPGSPAEFAAFVAKETPVWTQMVRESGATAQ